MDKYIIKKNGKVITQVLLDMCEKRGMSEQKIAEYLGITRKALWKIRKKMGWPQRVRSDKGKPRKIV
jgi:predicted transcriptional regulator